MNIEEDLKPLSPEEIIDNLRPATYKLKIDNKYHYGFIAQDVLEKFGDEYDFVTKGQDGYFALNYHEFIAPIVSLLKKQSEEIRYLKQKIENLEK